MGEQQKVGIVLTGGGARAAYQAGALVAIAEFAKEWGLACPVDIITGNSAGALNAVYLASNSHDFYKAAYNLQLLWSSISTEQVYKADPFSLTKMGMRWLTELSTGRFRRKRVRSLLDTTPLLKLIQSVVDFDRIQDNIEAEHIESLAITAANYSLGISQIFYQSYKSIPSWKRYRREGIRMPITAEHVMGSTAIPLLFPPVKINGHYYGDGSLRNNLPLSPAIRLGADKLLIIGVRKQSNAIEAEDFSAPSLARIIGTILNSVLIDSVDTDYESLCRINALLEEVGGNNNRIYRDVSICLLRPSENIGHIALSMWRKMPPSIRHLLRGLGTPHEGSDLISYLLFEPAFTEILIDMGYQDTLKQKEMIKQFFLSS